MAAIDPSFAAIIAAPIVATGAILKLTFDHLRNKDAAFTEALQASEQRQEKFLENHLANNTKVLGEIATNMAVTNRELKLLHKDNLVTAKVLLAADKNKTRKVEEQNNK